jgi:hypothetical protein
MRNVVLTGLVAGCLACPGRCAAPPAVDAAQESAIKALTALGVSIGHTRTISRKPGLTAHIGRLDVRSISAARPLFRRLRSLREVQWCGLESRDRQIEAVLGLDNIEELWVHSCIVVTDVGMERVGQLRGLRELYLGSCPFVTDRGLERLGNLRSLELLWLTHMPEVTGAGIKGLRRLHRLRRLNLDGTQVTDTGVEALSALPRLECIELNGTGVTDKCFEHLARMRRLQAVALYRTEVTDEGVRAFRKARPDVEVHGDYADNSSFHAALFTILRNYWALRDFLRDLLERADDLSPAQGASPR